MIQVVCGIIQNAAGEILICQRPRGKHLGGLWEFPGGKVDAGEDYEVALARELLEELAIKVKVGDALRPIRWDYETCDIELHPFHCLIQEGVPLLHEHERLIWCSPADFKSYEWAPADMPIVEALMEEWVLGQSAHGSSEMRT